MVMEKQEALKTYNVTGENLKAFVGAGADETIYTVELGDRIKIVTKKGTNPILYSHYFVTIPEARTALLIGDLEDFYSVNFSADSLTIITLKKIK